MQYAGTLSSQPPVTMVIDKLLVIHAYLSVFGEMQLHRQGWIAAQQTCWDCSVSCVGFKLPWLPGQMILNDKFTILKTDATMDSFFKYNGTRVPQGHTMLCVIIENICILV